MKQLIGFFAIFLAYYSEGYAALGRAIQQSPNSGNTTSTTTSHTSESWFSGI